MGPRSPELYIWYTTPSVSPLRDVAAKAIEMVPPVNGGYYRDRRRNMGFFNCPHWQAASTSLADGEGRPHPDAYGVQLLGKS